MLTPRLRLTLAIASFVTGAYLLVVGDYAGVVFLGGAAYFGYSYFKYGTVWLAFREVARGHMNEAAALLQQVKEPQALGSEQRAYFELASGLVCASRAQNQKAEAHLQIALDHRLRTENDRALAEAVLAQLLVARDQLEAAREIVERAVKRECRPGIAARIKDLHEQLQPPAAPPA
jgi:tetratricopeptide (TPR) repeat protein